MELKHQWIGKVESSEQFLKRNRKISIFNLILGLIIVITAIFIIFVYPGWPIVTSSFWTKGYFFGFVAIGAIFLILGLILLVHRSYFVGLHFFVDDNDIQYLLKNGVLRTDIEKILSDAGIKFFKRKKLYSIIYYELPEGLSIGVGGPIEQGIMVGKPISLIMIHIQNISSENMELAKRIQKLLDNLNIQDNYMVGEKKKKPDVMG